MTTLTPRQKEVCDLAVQGLTDKEIGRRLGISHRTVQDHVSNAFQIYGVKNKVGLLYRMMEGANGAS
jgi:DNA-binding CsgD family transcriptional regulator